MRAIAGLSAALVLAGAGGALAQEATDWSGFYASVHAGYALDREGAHSSLQFIPAQPIGGSVASGTISDQQSRIESLLGGVGAGYNFQIDKFVLGVEGNLNTGGLGKSLAGSYRLSVTDGVDVATLDIDGLTSTNMDWFTSLTGSFGVAFDQDWLVSIKGGIALANISSTSTITSNLATSDPAYTPFPPIVPLGVSQSSATSSQVLIGPTFGVGVEKMLTPNFSVGAEYVYVALPTANVPVAASPLGGGGGGATNAVDLGFHTLKASVKYHF